MALSSDSSSKEEVKTQFVTREGIYRLMTLSEYSRSNRVGYPPCGSAVTPVRVSLVTVPSEGRNGSTEDQEGEDRICFNHGKELYVYVYRGVKKAADHTKPIEKKVFKGINPTCHDFNPVNATHDSALLVIGFSTGQMQVIDPIKREMCRVYNEERTIDKTRVTCIRWVPGSSTVFVSTHASGNMYVMDTELPAAPAPAYTPLVAAEGFTVQSGRQKLRNPVAKWTLGEGTVCLHEVAFSPSGVHLAAASQDGFLRVFNYSTMELVGRARSYFGGLTCVAWSPDGKYVAVGGEDDLVTVWSLHDRRVAARCQGHYSWVSVVAFDPFASVLTEPEEGVVVAGSGDERKERTVQCYRLGSVAQDTQLCLWDVTEDVLQPPVRARASAHLSPIAPVITTEAVQATANGVAGKRSPPPEVKVKGKSQQKGGEGSGSLGVNSLTARLAGFSFGERRAASVAGRGRSTVTRRDDSDPLRLIGTAACPRFREVPVLDPLVCKKIAHERLTALHFRADCLVTACADGCVNTWARPPRRAPPD